MIINYPANECWIWIFCYIYRRVAQKTAISVKNSMTEGKRKLEWRRVKKYIIFLLILFIPDPTIVKETFSRIFVNINIQIPFKKSAHAHNVFFGFGFCALLERRVDEIGNRKSKIILYLPHPSFARYHRIFNFFGPP